MERRAIYQAYCSGPALVEQSRIEGALILDNSNGIVFEPVTDEINAYLRSDVIAEQGMVLRSLVDPDTTVYGVNEDFTGIDLYAFTGDNDPALEERRGWYLGAINWNIAQMLIKHSASGEAEIHLLCLHDDVTARLSDLTKSEQFAAVGDRFADMWDLSDQNRYLFELNTNTAYIIDITTQAVRLAIDDEDEEATPTDTTTEQSFYTTVKVTEIVSEHKTTEYVHTFSPFQNDEPLIWDIYSYEARR